MGGSVRLSGRGPLLPECDPVVGAFAVSGGGLERLTVELGGDGLRRSAGGAPVGSTASTLRGGVAVHRGDLGEFALAEHEFAVHAVVGERLALTAVLGPVGSVTEPPLTLLASRVVLFLGLEPEPDCGQADVVEVLQLRGG